MNFKNLITSCKPARILLLACLFSPIYSGAQTDVASWAVQQIAKGALSWVGGEAMEEVFGNDPVTLSEESIAAIGAELSDVLDQQYVDDIKTDYDIFYKSYRAYDTTDFDTGSEGSALQLNRLSDLLTQGMALTQRLENLMLLDECPVYINEECNLPFSNTEASVIQTYMLAQTLYFKF